MGALTWTRAHLPHRAATAPDERPAHRWRRWEIAALFAAGYAIGWSLLLLTARTVFGMDSQQSLGFAFGVAGYILGFSAFITALAWSVSGARLDRPDRR